MAETLFPTNCDNSNKIAKCGSVSSKFAYLMQTKEMMRNILIQKGQDVPEDLPFRDYVEKIAAVQDAAEVVSSIIDYTGTPHKGDVTVDKTFIGLSNVDNTSDLDKPISTATQAALDKKQDIESQDLLTVSKTIVGAINELKQSIDTQDKSFIITEGKTNLGASATVPLNLNGSVTTIPIENNTIKDINLILLVTDSDNIINKFSYSFTLGAFNNKVILSESYLETLVSFGSAVNIKLDVIPNSTSAPTTATINISNLDNTSYEVLSSLIYQTKQLN